LSSQESLNETEDLIINEPEDLIINETDNLIINEPEELLQLFNELPILPRIPKRGSPKGNSNCLMVKLHLYLLLLLFTIYLTR